MYRTALEWMSKRIKLEGCGSHLLGLKEEYLNKIIYKVILVQQVK